jgi:hypothetical protein
MRMSAARPLAAVSIRAAAAELVAHMQKDPALAHSLHRLHSGQQTRAPPLQQGHRLGQGVRPPQGLVVSRMIGSLNVYIISVIIVGVGLKKNRCKKFHYLLLLIFFFLKIYF